MSGFLGAFSAPYEEGVRVRVDAPLPRPVAQVETTSYTVHDWMESELGLALTRPLDAKIYAMIYQRSCGSTGYFVVSQTELAKKAGCARQTVCRVLGGLVKKGLVLCQPTTLLYPDGREINGPNAYYTAQEPINAAFMRLTRARMSALDDWAGDSIGRDPMCAAGIGELSTGGKQGATTYSSYAHVDNPGRGGRVADKSPIATAVTSCDSMNRLENAASKSGNVNVHMLSHFATPDVTECDNSESCGNVESNGRSDMASTCGSFEETAGRDFDQTPIIKVYKDIRLLNKNKDIEIEGNKDLITYKVPVENDGLPFLPDSPCVERGAGQGVGLSAGAEDGACEDGGAAERGDVAEGDDEREDGKSAGTPGAGEREDAYGIVEYECGRAGSAEIAGAAEDGSESVSAFGFDGVASTAAESFAFDMSQRNEDAPLGRSERAGDAAASEAGVGAMSSPLPRLWSAEERDAFSRLAASWPRGLGSEAYGEAMEAYRGLMARGAAPERVAECARAYIDDFYENHTGSNQLKFMKSLPAWLGRADGFAHWDRVTPREDGSVPAGGTAVPREPVSICGFEPGDVVRLHGTWAYRNEFGCLTPLGLHSEKLSEDEARALAKEMVSR